MKSILQSQGVQERIKIQEKQNQSPESPSQKTGAKIQDQKCSFGQWTEKQTFKYFLFVYHHTHKFESKSMRKALKVFKQMAKFIKTRNSSQCRTHHQNLMSKQKNLQNALKNFINFNPSFFQKYESIKHSLRILDDIEFCEDTSTVVREAKSQGNEEVETSITDEGSKVKGKTKLSQNSIVIPQFSKDNSPQFDQKFKKMMECQLLFTMWMLKLGNLTNTTN